MALTEKLQIVELGAANEVVVLLDLNDGVHYMMETGTFQVIAPEQTPVLAADQRRWGGSREVGEVHANGAIEWVAGVTAATEQGALEKVESLLAQLAANPYHAYILWEVPGAAQPTLYEMRGTGTWAAKYSVAQVEGAQLFLFTIRIPVGPLALGLPKVQYTKAALSLPTTLALGTIPGDAPALAEVAIETGVNPTGLVSGLSSVLGIAVDATYVYYVVGKAIGRAKLNGEEPNNSFIKVTNEPAHLAVNAANIYWTVPGTGDVGRAAIGGGTVEEAFILGGDIPIGIALDATYVYWGSYGNGQIGRATLAGGSVNQAFITGAGKPACIAVNAGNVFWANQKTDAIGRATIAGGTVEPSW